MQRSQCSINTQAERSEVLDILGSGLRYAKEMLALHLCALAQTDADHWGLYAGVSIGRA
jgi:hypothetical protein